MNTHQRPTPVTLIDGRSGSGKTTLAARLADESGARTLHLEHLYPGWGGLAEGSLAVAAALAAGGYSRYDWQTARFAEWIPLDPTHPLIIEGCGAITPANVRAATRWSAQVRPGDPLPRTLWIDCPDPLRRARALARDGETYAPHWDSWAAQEEAHFAAAQPWLIAERVDCSGAEGRGLDLRRGQQPEGVAGRRR